MLPGDPIDHQEIEQQKFDRVLAELDASVELNNPDNKLVAIYAVLEKAMNMERDAEAFSFAALQVYQNKYPGLVERVCYPANE